MAMWAIFLVFSWTLMGADWPQFRGVRGMGLSADRDLPVEFGADRNVVGPRILLTAADGDKLLTICLEQKTGKMLWQREAPRPRSTGCIRRMRRAITALCIWGWNTGSAI
ncbi:MAG: hypothetical protein JNL62_17820 [Bryobacterales bacterium]|nr:hypothetical protein [Bryobacterales bacterium]